MEMTIHLLKPGKGTQISYRGTLLAEKPGYVLVHARWQHPPRDLGYVLFETGDHFYEHYYTERWYNILAIHTMAGVLKGWYCNVTRPARREGATIVSEDLELDLFVSPDRAQLLTLDLDEFEARNFARDDPETYAAALAALEELKQLAQTGQPPFGAAQNASRDDGRWTPDDG